MTGFKSIADPEYGKRSDAQACLLQVEGNAVHRGARVTPHEAHGGCALTQSRHGGLRANDRLPRGIAASPDVIFPAGVRITGIDRAIIRAYFHTPGEETPARRRRSEGYAKRAAAPRDRDGGLLPPELECKLTPLPGGYSRQLRGSAVVLIEDATRKIVDAVRRVAVREV